MFRDVGMVRSYIRFRQGKLIRGEHEYQMGAGFGHTL